MVAKRRQGVKQTTRFIVVRHGETRWNLESRIQGHGDSSLTEAGCAQADAIAHRLAAEPFDALISSDLGRALETAARIAAVTRHEVIPDARFRERNFGSAEGLTYTEMHERFPGIFARHLQEADPDYRIPEAESRREFYVRVGAAFEALAREHPGRCIALVCHGGVLASLYRHVHAMPHAEIAAISIPNAAYNRVSRSPAGWSIEAWADVAHFESQ